MSTPSMIRAVLDSGVSLWLDDLGRERITSGELHRLVDTWGITGVTTNPSIFAAAITNGAAAYSASLDEFADAGDSAEQAVMTMMVDDVRAACDQLADVYQRAEYRDGYVSIEVDPRLAHDSEGTIAHAQELWERVDRPNVMIKIPGTSAGLSAITEVLARGINVNVTLIFGVERYGEVLHAHAQGLRAALERGTEIGRIMSVASVFVSRLDTAVDTRLDHLTHDVTLSDEQRSGLQARRGRAAVLNAQQAYARFREHVVGDEWSLLALQGALPQRPLWASTGTKDPTYSPVKYVTELMTPGAVNTVPFATLNLLAEHHDYDLTRTLSRDGEPSESAPASEQALTPTSPPAGFDDVATQLRASGLSYPDIIAELETAGVAAFETAWCGLIESVAGLLAERRVAK